MVKREVKPSRQQYRERLAIDLEDLDQSLMEQPELFNHVAEAHADAVSDRDALQLELDELTADLDKVARDELFRKTEKVTEKMVSNRVKQSRKWHDMTEQVRAAKREADKWAALKEAFVQRSKMLRELVAWKLGELYSLGVERGAAGGRAALRDAGARRAELLRSRKLSGEDD